MWFKIENFSVSNSNELCKIWRKNQYPPFPRKRERERKREQESNKGHYQLLLHLYNDNG